MKIELAVDESDIGQVRNGQAVTFTADAFPNRQFRGVVDQVRMSATTTSNVVTYPVVVTVDNSDGTLLPGLTVNAEIEVSKRSDVLKVANAALRYKPANEDDDASAAAPQAGARGGAGGGSSGIIDDLSRTATGLGLDAKQQAAFDAAAESIKQRQAARQAAPRPQGNALFGGGRGFGGGGGGGGGQMQAQMRQRMMDRFQQDFAPFRASLDDAQRAQWDSAVSALVGATRAAVYKLVDGKPQKTMVRIGASDGTDTEISGDVKAGDELVTGERAAGPAAAPAQ
ncbi:MAG: HlyD family efflux transporter periplasmic adaptor subunit [Lysobacter sp.]|nr:HlyD family efflux transporter periplasmic adaptor subunit [Lysobacter sp.]